ncbi:hypothetical protein BpHYR1_045704 [Brachionus plicatilis]|uniref:Uncharacterized protein n=1 Tax=Brachionus plicatilis TaxID=10195 RepID=A0A3M7SXF5_BRAPC|nr:hypothetical protein BpHYR1_045704 [Brachionus plicatilis]
MASASVIVSFIVKHRSSFLFGFKLPRHKYFPGSYSPLFLTFYKKYLLSLSFNFLDSYENFSDRHCRRVRDRLENILIELDDKLIPIKLKIHLVQIVFYENAKNDLKNSFKLEILERPFSHHDPRKLLYFKDLYCLSDNYFLKNSEDLDSFNGPLKIKLSADGKNVGRNLKIINFTFTVLNECDKAKTSKGNYTIGMAHLDEEYSDLKEPLAYINSHLEKLKEIKMENKIFNIQYFFCSDWKFTAVALAKENLGYKDLNLINFDYHFCLIDTLHLFLRITDKLLELFIIELCAFDNIENVKKNSLTPDLIQSKTEHHVTPNIHAFCSHVHQFQKFHGDINLFNLQGLEKLNDQTTIQYFRASNKREKKIEQLIQRRLRKDDFLYSI